MLHSLGRANPLSIVGISYSGAVYGQANELVKTVVAVDCTAGVLFAVSGSGFSQGVAVGVVGVSGDDGLVILGLCLRQQAVIGVIGVIGRVGFRACDSHLAPVASGVVGIVHRQAVCLRFLGQPA